MCYFNCRPIESESATGGLQLATYFFPVAVDANCLLLIASRFFKDLPAYQPDRDCVRRSYAK